VAVINKTARIRSKLYRIPQAKAYLNDAISEKTLRQWIFKRRIPFVRIGGAVCISEDVLEGLKEEVPAEEYVKPTRKNPRRLPASAKPDPVNV